MFIIVLLIVVVVLYTYNKSLGPGVSNRCENAPYGQPKIHKWVQKPMPDERGYLICSQCSKIPGED